MDNFFKYQGKKISLFTQKSTWTIFFKYQGKMFLNIEKVLVKISEEQT